MIKKLALAGLACLLAATATAQEQTSSNRIDLIRPDAPELARHGDLPIGVRTVEVTNPNQIDIVNATGEGEPPRYDRQLTVEVWYPAAEGTGSQGEYRVFLRDGETQATIHGRGVRDAKAAAKGPYPLVIISHGYPGNRFLLSHLAENLATKGYVVASIDHRDSTYNDQKAFGSTLINRPLDQIFVLNEMARMSAEPGHFLEGLVDPRSAGLVGYSMGAYGAVVTAGGGVTKAIAEAEGLTPRGTYAIHQAGSEALAARRDERIKAVVAIAPWGRQRNFWDAEGLAKITTPIFFMAGSVDSTSGYEEGVKKIFTETTNAERYLLTFANANHNAAAPMPAPLESWPFSAKLGWAPFEHYADPVWDTVRMNNIAQHFTTAFFDLHLKGNEASASYLDLVEDPAKAVMDRDDAGKPTRAHTYWKGFGDHMAAGLTLMRGKPAQ